MATVGFSQGSPGRVDEKVLWKCLIGISVLLYGALQPQFHTGVYNDDAVYILASRLLGGGHLPQLPRADITRGFPFPGLPVLLIPIVKLFAPHWLAAEWLSTVATALAAILFWSLLRKWFSPVEGLCVLAAFVFNPTVAHFSGVLMPEPYFLVALLGSLLLLENLIDKPTRLKAWGLGILLGWGSLLRAEGVLLLISLPVMLVMSRRWTDLGRVWISSGAIWLFFILRCWAAYHSVNLEYASDLLALVAFWKSHAGLVFFFSRDLLRVLFVDTVLGLEEGALPGWASNGVVVLCLGVAAVGFRSLWRRSQVSHDVWVGTMLFCTLYFGVHVFWHIAIQRYCMALLPFTLVFLASGIFTLSAYCKPRRYWIVAAMTLLCLSYGYRDGYAVYESLWVSQPLNSPPWKSLAWLQRYSPPSANVLSPISPSVALYAERSSLSGIDATDEAEFRYLLLRVPYDYIVDRPVNLLTTDTGNDGPTDLNQVWKRIRIWVRLQPESYRLIYDNPVEQTTIYRVAQDPRYIAAYEIYLSALKDLESGHADRGMLKLHASLAIYPRLAPAYNALGATYYLTQTHPHAAERALRRAVEINSQYDVALLNLARLYHRWGQPERSRVYVRKSIAASVTTEDERSFRRIVCIARDRGEIDLPPHVQWFDGCPSPSGTSLNGG
jgi:tetratricopeptide (TPR) repeat protein